jgi:hypothetical protein
MPLSTQLNVGLVADQTSPLDLGTVAAKIARSMGIVLGDGAGAGQANRMVSDTRTLAASSNEDLDLAGGLLDAFGVAVTFARVKLLLIAAAAGNTNNVVVGAAAATQWTTLLNAAGTVTLRPGELMVVACGPADSVGHTVTAGTGDLLRVANSGAGTSVTYDIIVIGAAT